MRNSKCGTPTVFTGEELASLRRKDPVSWSWFAEHRIGDIVWAPLERLPGVQGEEELSRRVRYWPVKVVRVEERGVEDDEEDERLEQEWRIREGAKEEEARKAKERRDARRAWRKPWPDPDGVMVEVELKYMKGKQPFSSSSPSPNSKEKGNSKDNNEDSLMANITPSSPSRLAPNHPVTDHALDSELLHSHINFSHINNVSHSHRKELLDSRAQVTDNDYIESELSRHIMIESDEVDDNYTDGTSSAMVNQSAPFLAFPDGDDPEDQDYVYHSRMIDDIGDDTGSHRDEYSLRRRSRTNFTPLFFPILPAPSATSSSDTSSLYTDVLKPPAIVQSTTLSEKSMSSYAPTPIPSPSISTSSITTTTTLSSSAFSSPSSPTPTRSRSQTIYVVQPLPNPPNFTMDGSSSSSSTGFHVPLFELLLPDCAAMDPVVSTPSAFHSHYRIPASVLLPYLAREPHVEDHVLWTRAVMEATEASGQWATPPVDVEEIERLVRRGAGAHALGKRKLHDYDGTHSGEDVSEDDPEPPDKQETEQHLTIEYTRLRIGTEEVQCGDIVALRGGGQAWQGQIEGGGESSGGESEGDDERKSDNTGEIGSQRKRRHWWSTRTRQEMMVVERVVREEARAEQFLKGLRPVSDGPMQERLREVSPFLDSDGEVDSDYESKSVQKRRDETNERAKLGRGRVMIEGKVVFRVDIKDNEEKNGVDFAREIDVDHLDGIYFLETERRRNVVVTDVRGRVRPRFLNARLDGEGGSKLWKRGMPVVAEAVDAGNGNTEHGVGRGVSKITVVRVPSLHIPMPRKSRKQLIGVVVEVRDKRHKKKKVWNGK